MIKVSSNYFSPLPYIRCYLRSTQREKPRNWKTSHMFALSNPILSLLEKCISMTELKQVQAQMVTTGLILDSFASSRLIAFCAISEWKNLEYCTRLLFSVQNANVFSWNFVIRGFSDSEDPKEAFMVYKNMLGKCASRPDYCTYPSLLNSCARLSFISVGFQILSHVLQFGFGGAIYVHNAVIHMLASCGELGLAQEVFDGNCARDLVSWNSLINGYSKNGKAREALNLYQKMETEGVQPDEVTMFGVISACGQFEDFSLGRKLHNYIMENGLDLTIRLINSLMDMYIKCGNLEAAQKLFDGMVKKTMVSWTTIIVGYAKFGLLDEARKLFNEMPEKDVVPWNALIDGYVRKKRSKEALALFHEMQAHKVTPDEITMVSCLSACVDLGALDVGIWIHRYIEKRRLPMNVALGTSLIDMYAKCGNIARAQQVFREMSETNSITWTSIICGLALHGKAHDALAYFSEMIDTGLMPDEITFLGVLSACCHGGLVDEGRKYFAKMRSVFNISPKQKHYSCMVDLLGRAGLLQEAEDLIVNMPMEADAVVWGILFFACRTHGNVVMGERAARKLLELDAGDSGTYVLLANMYGDANKWVEAGKIRKMMRERGVEKKPGCSSIEVNGVINEFIVRDKSHDQSEQIYECLAHLTKQSELLYYAFTTCDFGSKLLFDFELGNSI